MRVVFFTPVRGHLSGDIFGLGQFLKKKIFGHGKFLTKKFLALKFLDEKFFALKMIFEKKNFDKKFFWT